MGISGKDGWQAHRGSVYYSFYSIYYVCLDISILMFFKTHVIVLKSCRDVRIETNKSQKQSHPTIWDKKILKHGKNIKHSSQGGALSFVSIGHTQYG